MCSRSKVPEKVFNRVVKERLANSKLQIDIKRVREIKRIRLKAQVTKANIIKAPIP
jgi:hypothetical protein